MLFQLDKPWEWLQIAMVIVMKIAIERVFRVLPPMCVRIVVYFIPENVILLYYGTRTTVQWNGITARNTLLTTGYSLRLAAIARLFYAPERPDPPIQVTGKIGTGIPYRIPNYFNTGNPGLWLYFSNPCCLLRTVLMALSRTTVPSSLR
jgi:hypothetical protein